MESKEKVKKMYPKPIIYAPKEEVLAEVERIIEANQKLMKKLAKM